MQTENLPYLKLSGRARYDLELLLSGGFAPLTGFMTEAEYESVCKDMKLPSGTIWPMPIVLDVPDEKKKDCAPGKTIVLTDPYGTPLATMDITDQYTPDKKKEARHIYGTESEDHAGVRYLYNQIHNTYIGGKIKKIKDPEHFNYTHLRKTPTELKQYFSENNITRVVGFQTRNPMHRAHLALVKNAMQEFDAHALIHPVVGLTKEGDIPADVRVRCYESIMETELKENATLAVLPLAMRMAGPREALWHAIIRKNHGCTHFIIGRDHASPGKDKDGASWYDPYAAQHLVEKHAEDIGITPIPMKEHAYVVEDDAYEAVDDIDPNKTIKRISGTEIRTRLYEGKDIPAWFSFPRVIEILKDYARRKNDAGLTIFFTGLSGSGKSTLARSLVAAIEKNTGRSVTLLDGDVVRENLSKGLTFSKEDRDINVRRIGFVAKEITRHRGIAVCAAIAPYEAARAHNRAIVEAVGPYIEVHVATPLAVCEARDPKGLYQKARKGEIPNFTGVSDPYEAPINAELTFNTEKETPEAQTQAILRYLEERGLLTEKGA